MDYNARALRLNSLRNTPVWVDILDALNDVVKSYEDKADTIAPETSNETALNIARAVTVAKKFRRTFCAHIENLGVPNADLSTGESNNE